MIVYECLHNDDLGSRCSERGCVFPAQASGKCRQHEQEDMAPEEFQRLAPDFAINGYEDLENA